MKIKKMVDAERLKDIFECLGDKRAVEIIEMEQGYTKFYAAIISRMFLYDKRSAPLSEIPDDNIRYIVSVIAKNEAEARKLIKERIDARLRSQGKNGFVWPEHTVRFIDKETAETRAVYHSYTKRHIGLFRL